MKLFKLVSVVLYISLFGQFQATTTSVTIAQHFKILSFWCLPGIVLNSIKGGYGAVGSKHKGDLVRYITCEGFSKKKVTIIKSAATGALSGLGGFGVYYFRDPIKQYTPFGLGNYVVPVLAVCFSYLTSLCAQYLVYEQGKDTLTESSDSDEDVADGEPKQEKKKTAYKESKKHLECAVRGALCTLGGFTVVELPYVIGKLCDIAYSTQG